MTTTTSTVRPYAESDFEGVVDLLQRAERIPGQPDVTSSMLRDALAGTSPIDGGWWAELAHLETLVVPADGGRIAGAVSVGTSKTDGAGYILWLAADSQVIVDELLAGGLGALSGTSTQRAFSFATALGDGLEALPVTRRRHVHDALLRLGFRGEDLWVYMRRDLTGSLDPRLIRFDEAAGLIVDQVQAPQSWKISAAGGADEGTVEITLLPSGTGMLDWLHVDEPQRGRGLGRTLLVAGLRQLASAGARQVILYVDHDAPGTDRDRTAALGLYTAMGFDTVDHLYSYERTGA